MEFIIGASIGVIFGLLFMSSKKRNKKRPLTKNEQQEIIEQAAIIQPIIRDDQSK